MDRRWTDAEMWDKQWFRELDPKQKLLFRWVLDHCEPDGYIKPDWGLAGFQIGESVEHDDMTPIVTAKQVEVLEGGAYFIPEYVAFQQGTLSHNSPPHQKIFAAAERHGLVSRFQNILKKDGPVAPRNNHSPQGGNVPQPKGNTPQPPPEPPEDQQQIPIKDLPIEKKYPGHCARLIPRLRTLLNARFGRQKEQRWSYAEEFELVKVASRELPIEEFTAIQDMYAETEAKYIPNTAKNLMSFLQNWASFVEKAAASGFTIIPNKTAHHSDYFIWPWCTRESGGPKPEQFDDTERGKADYASFRNAYDSWVKK